MARGYYIRLIRVGFMSPLFELSNAYSDKQATTSTYWTELVRVIRIKFKVWTGFGKLFKSMSWPGFKNLNPSSS